MLFDHTEITRFIRHYSHLHVLHRCMCASVCSLIHGNKCAQLTRGPDHSETRTADVSLVTLWGHSHAEFKRLQLPSSWLELMKPLGWDVKHLQETEKGPVAYDKASRIYQEDWEPSSIPATFFCLCVHARVHWCSTGCDQCSQVFTSTVQHLLFECVRIGLCRAFGRWGKTRNVFLLLKMMTDPSIAFPSKCKIASAKSFELKVTGSWMELHRWGFSERLTVLTTLIEYREAVESETLPSTFTTFFKRGEDLFIYITFQQCIILNCAQYLIEILVF